MFSKTKEADTTAPVQQPAAKRTTRTGVPSIISADLTVRGTLISTGDIQIDGRVEGDVRAGALVVGEKASIQGEIYAEDAIIRGRVEGGIRARKVQLCATSHVDGNILHETLSMETGAFFEGNCRHSDNPLGEGADHVRGPHAPASFVAKQGPHAVTTALSSSATATPIKPNGNHGDQAVVAQPRPAGATFMPIKS